MKRTIINFNIRRGETKWVAECAQLPIITEGNTIDETCFNINEAVKLHLEDEDLEKLNISSNPAISINIDMGEIQYA